MALPIYTHIPNLKSLTKIFFKLSLPKGNLCGSGGGGSGGGVTILNPKYPRLSSGDTIIKIYINPLLVSLSTTTPGQWIKMITLLSTTYTLAHYVLKYNN